MSVIAGNARDASNAAAIRTNRIDLPVGVFAIARKGNLIAFGRPSGEVITVAVTVGEHGDPSGCDVQDAQALAAFILESKDNLTSMGDQLGKSVVSLALRQQAKAAAIGRHDCDIRYLAALIQDTLERSPSIRTQ